MYTKGKSSMKLLHIDTSILGEDSISRRVSGAIVDRLRRAEPGIEVTYRDLGAEPLSHFSSADLAFADPALDEFLAADVVVIGAPMYNFSIPSQLKAWIDRIVVAGKTFRYDEHGAKGLAGDKRVIVAVSRGGLYGPETPSAAAEHVETYLRTVLGFIGVADPELIVAEGIKIGPEHREKALEGALLAATKLRAPQRLAS
jgi:FMN-dependent NADH-azoreductase